MGKRTRTAHSEETKAKMSESMKAYFKRKEEAGEEIKRGSGFPKGHKHTEETIAKMKAYWAKQRELGIGKSPETRAKMSAAKRGVPKSPEHKAAMSAAHLKRHEDKRNGLV